MGGWGQRESRITDEKLKCDPGMTKLWTRPRGALEHIPPNHSISCSAEAAVLLFSISCRTLTAFSGSVLSKVTLQLRKTLKELTASTTYYPLKGI